jgi:TPR repeat protein
MRKLFVAREELVMFNRISIATLLPGCMLSMVCVASAVCIASAACIASAVCVVYAPPASALTTEDAMSMYNAMARGDFAAAVPLMKKGAAEGDTMCQKNLAALYTTGVPGVLAKSDSEALNLYKKAAAKLDGDALAALGNAHVNGLLGAPRDYPKAKQYFEKAISLGSARGKAGLATLYLKGWAVEQNLVESFKLMREAAFQKVPGATYNLAEYYRRGLGCEKNMNEAISLYTKAAPGLVQQVRSAPQSGQLNCAVGVLYQNGWGVPKDAKVAGQYFALAIPKLRAQADAGNTTAMLFLSELTSNGWGTTKNAAAGEALLKKAANAGDGEAKWELSLVANTITPGSEPKSAQTKTPGEPVSGSTEAPADPKSTQTESPTEPKSASTETPGEPKSDQTKTPSAPKSAQTESPTESKQDAR